MSLTTQQACIRQAQRENLVPELVAALTETAAMLQSVCLVIADADARKMAIDAVQAAHFVLGKVEGARS